MTHGRGSGILIEVCVDSVLSALSAQKGGADRVELCDNLLEGGTTPSEGMIALAASKLRIGLHVMIRPRGGDFCYSPAEFEVMKRDIQTAKKNGADGVVFGVLTREGRVDRKRNGELLTLAHGMSVTFHRAFDMTRDPFEALETLIDLGFSRVLTSGQQPSAMQGLAVIRQLHRYAAGRIHVMAGGGVGRAARTIVSRTGIREIHVTGTMTVKSPMRFRNLKIRMGHPHLQEEYSLKTTDPNRIRAIRMKVQGKE